MSEIEYNSNKDQQEINKRKGKIEYNSNKDQQEINQRKEEAKIRLLEINNHLKTKMFWCVIGFLAIYSIISFVIIFLYGFGVLKLSEPIIITILTTTFIEIIALPKMICKHLFPTNSNN